MIFDVRRLADEFDPNLVHWRVQGSPYKRGNSYSAMALCYIDSRDVMDRLDEVCGPENWQVEHLETPRGRILTRIGIKINEEWVWKSDGAGETQVEGEKGGISDGIKRAAVHWGIGRYLYRLDTPWVSCDVKEKGGKAYWKAWKEDPWSKVKRSSYQIASQERSNQSSERASLPISGEQCAIIVDLAERAGTDRKAVFDYLKIKGEDWSDLPADKFDDIRRGMQGKLDEMEMEKQNG